MIIMGIRVPKNEAVVYRYYDTDTEFCTIDTMRFGDLQTSVIRRTDRLPVMTLCTSFDAETTFFPGMERSIMDMETGQTVGILHLKEMKETYLNDRYLFRGDASVVKVWDLARRGDPVAMFNLKPLGNTRYQGGVDRFVFMCDNHIDEKLQLCFLLYPSMWFM